LAAIAFQATRNDWPSAGYWRQTPETAKIRWNRSSCGSLERIIGIALTSLNLFLAASLLVGHPFTDGV